MKPLTDTQKIQAKEIRAKAKMCFSGTSNSVLVVLLSLALNHLCVVLGTSNNNPYPFLTWDVSQIANREFDYIVVGGGTAGCPLAVTLSQNFSVLLLERGTSPFGVPDIERGDAYLKPLAYADNYTSIAQVFTSEDGVPNVRARVLGGGTALNAGFYSRGSRKMTSFDMGLEEYLVEQSYRWIESKLVHKPISLATLSSAMLVALLDASVLPYNGFTLQHVVGTKYSGSIFDESGKRHVAAELLDYANANNIVVLLNSTVARVLFESGGTGAQPRSYGVEFEDRNRVSYTAKLKSGKHSEVILCAGALGSPQLLMLSGIGPAAHLKSLGIPVVADSPVVGNGMADNPGTFVNLQSSTRLNWSPSQVVGITENSSTYIEGTGTYDKATKISAESFLQKLAFPKSSGQLRLKNLDPRENPAVRFNYYSHPNDLQTCVSGVRKLSDMLKSPAIRRFGYPNVTSGSVDLRYIGNSPPENVSNLTAVEEYCLNSISTIYHFHGGCWVGSVVDPKNRVNGVEGLRVVDGSTFKDSPGTNPQATTMMLGRYKAIQILQERSSG